MMCEEGNIENRKEDYQKECYPIVTEWKTNYFFQPFCAISISTCHTTNRPWLTLLSKKYFHIPFFVLQLVKNRGFMSVPRRTNQDLEGPKQRYPGPAGSQ